MPAAPQQRAGSACGTSWRPGIAASRRRGAADTLLAVHEVTRIVVADARRRRGRSGARSPTSSSHSQTSRALGRERLALAVQPVPARAARRRSRPSS